MPKEKTTKVPYYSVQIRNARNTLFLRSPTDERGFWIENHKILKIDQDAKHIIVPLWVAIAKELAHG